MFVEITKRKENKKKDHKDKSREKLTKKERRSPRKKKSQRTNPREKPEEGETEMAKNDVDLRISYFKPYTASS